MTNSKFESYTRTVSGGHSFQSFRLYLFGVKKKQIFSLTLEPFSKTSLTLEVGESFSLTLEPDSNDNNNLTNSYWSIGSMNVKEDRAQTREMGGMETQFQCGHYNNFNGVLQNI